MLIERKQRGGRGGFLFTEAGLEEAGRFKATERLSLADAFAVALSVIKKGRLVSSDHGEFDIIEKKGLAEFYWLRYKII